MKSWKTTVGGLLMAIGAWMQTNSEPVITTIGTVAMVVGAALLGITAKDSNVTGGTKKQ